MLSGKNIVVGVTGGVAVYKAVDVVSRLIKLKANVNVIMTEHATKFVTPLTFQSLSNNYVVTDMFDEPKSWDVEHISLAQKADLFLVVPATANVIGKINAGIADDMLTTTLMATTAPVLIAPAMNTNMYLNPIVQRNIESLRALDYNFVEPASGRLACGDIGVGKLPDPEVIVERCIDILSCSDELYGKSVLITAGPTREDIDPVRYITNHSTGRMGYALAREAARRGAKVTLVSGPTDLTPPQNVEFISVVSASEMYEAVMARKSSDVIIKSAAVSDYRPKVQVDKKIKKGKDDFNIELTRNEDILASLGHFKDDQILVGFAAETNDVIENAKKKLKSKNLDFIVANDLTMKGAGFKSDTNIISIIDKNETVTNYEIMKKERVAIVLFDKIVNMLK